MAQQLRRHTVCVLVTLTIHPGAAKRVTTGEIVHYSFEFAECSAGPAALFSDVLAPTNLQHSLRRGLGSSCEPKHLGVTLNSTCMADNAVSQCRFAPISGVAGASLFGGVTAGFTLELWLTPARNQRAFLKSDTMTLLAIGSASMTGDGDCGTPGSNNEPMVTMRLLQTKQGCLMLELLVQKEVAQAGGITTPLCSTLFSEAPKVCVKPHIDVTSPALTHVAIAIAANLTAPMNGMSRAAFYVNGVAVLDSEKNVYPDMLLLDNINEVVGFQGIPVLVPQVVWGGLGHILRLGSDGVMMTPPPHYAWFGTIYMAAIYNRPLTSTEVRENFEANLDDSAPIASNVNVTVMEDNCTQLKDVTSSVYDWDNVGFLHRTRYFTFKVQYPAVLCNGVIAGE